MDYGIVWYCVSCLTGIKRERRQLVKGGKKGMRPGGAFNVS
jgi:hypothetical protein